MATKNNKKVRITEEQLTSGHLEAQKLRMYALRSSMYRIRYKNDASPEEKVAWEPLSDYFLMKASIAEYVLECRECDTGIKAARKRLAAIEEAGRSYPKKLNYSVGMLRTKLYATVSHDEKRIQDLKECISNFREEIAQKQDLYDHLLSYLRINLDDDELRPTSKEIMSKRAREYRSTWKTALREALRALGIGSSCKQVANWLGDRFPGIERPEYFGSGQRQEIGFLVTNTKEIRKQFQKDLSRVRNEMKQDSSNI